MLWITPVSACPAARENTAFSPHTAGRNPGTITVNRHTFFRADAYVLEGSCDKRRRRIPQERRSSSSIDFSHISPVFPQISDSAYDGETTFDAAQTGTPFRPKRSGAFFG